MFTFLKRLFHRTPRYQTYQEFLREWNAKQAEDMCLGCGCVPVGECTCDYVDEYAPTEESEEDAQRWADDEAARMEYWDEDDEGEDNYCQYCGMRNIECDCDWPYEGVK